jgi:RNA polymerase sigma-70 factor (ECF subfamily)
MTPGGKPGVVSAPSSSQISLRDAPRPAPVAAIVPVASPAALPSFEAVYRTHARTVSRWASRVLGPGGDLEDVVQEVFIVVRKKLPRFDGRAAIATWLYEITVRVVQDWRRRRRWWSWVTGRGPSPSRSHAQAAPWPSDEGAPDPVVRLEVRERLLRVYRILDGLGEAYRTTFILFELEGLSGERIAEITGTRVGTVWVRLTRARRAFIERMRQLAEQERAEQEREEQKKERP